MSYNVFDIRRQIFQLGAEKLRISLIFIQLVYRQPAHALGQGVVEGLAVAVELLRTVRFHKEKESNLVAVKTFEYAVITLEKQFMNKG